MCNGDLAAFFVAVQDVLPTKDLCPSLVNDSCIDTTASHPCSRHEPTHMSEKGAHGIIGDLTQQAQHPRSTHPRSSVQVPLLKITWLTRPLRLTSRRGLKLLESYGTKGGNCSRCNWKETNFKLGKSDHECYNFILVANQPSTGIMDLPSFQTNKVRGDIWTTMLTHL
jgi:hypothetical protein